MAKRDLLDMDRAALQTLVAEWEQPSYRVDQIWNWIYVKRVASIAEMSELPLSLRARLTEEATIGVLSPLLEQRSTDGETIKWLFDIPAASAVPRSGNDRATHQIETVLMRYRRRLTACVSSQAGCGMSCAFCATGQMGFQRNLTAGEIVAQVLFVARELARQGKRLTNIVLMGMGEPLANYEATLIALRRLGDPQGLNMGQRHITLSTVGLVPGIDRFSREGLQVGLAVSLHAATDELRNTLVPINRRYPLEPLIAACREYVKRTHRRVSFEWALIAGVNDGIDQAQALAHWVRGLLCHVNVIPLNPTKGYPGMPSPREQVAAFCAELERHGVPNSVRVRRGIDIQAGCGQLRERALELRGNRRTTEADGSPTFA